MKILKSTICSEWENTFLTVACSLKYSKPHIANKAISKSAMSDNANKTKIPKENNSKPLRYDTNSQSIYPFLSLML